MNLAKKKTEAAKVEGSSARAWLFGLLVVVGAAIMLVAWFNPWWTIDVEGFAADAAQIHPWGLEMTEQMGGFAVLLKGTEMPSWFGAFMWVFLGLCMLALLVGIFAGGEEIQVGKVKFSISQLLISGVGFACIVCAAVAAVYAGMRMKSTFNVPLQGRGYIDMGDPLIAYVDTYLLPGYYLMYAAGLWLLALGFFHKKITGEK